MTHRAPASRTAFCAIILWICSCPGCLLQNRNGAHDEYKYKAGNLLRLRKEQQHAGTLFQIDVVTDNEAKARSAIDEAFKVVAQEEAILTEFQEASDVSAVNRAAGIAPAVVNPETLAVVARSLYFSELTAGAFDITFAVCGQLWSIREQRVPSDESVSECLKQVGYRRVAVDAIHATIFLRDHGMRLGLAGLAKGYLVDCAADVLIHKGFTSFVVNGGGGDLRVQGRNGDQPWEVQIRHPRDPGKTLGSVFVDRGAVSTSGDYFRYFELDGIRYHHIMDPATGKPTRSSVAATVVAETAMDSDALATSLFVMGPEKGLALVEKLENVEALIVGPDLVAHSSRGFARYTRPSAATAGSAGAGHDNPLDTFQKRVTR